MSGRRLPLLSTAEQPVATVSAARLVLPGRALIVADTGTDVHAFSWAAHLVAQLGRLGVRVPVVLSAWAGAPAPAEQARRFEQLSGARSVLALGGAEIAERLPGAADDDLWVLVGQPGLIAAHAWLSVLLAADAPLLRWPPGVRALRDSVSLELSGTGLEVAPALARALAAGGVAARS